MIDGPRRERPDGGRREHIVLAGLMGSGKSTVGLLVANELGRPLVDSDSIVHLRTGRSPAELLAATGVDHLHQQELDALRSVLAVAGAVVFAAAASVVETAEPSDLEPAWVVWLDASPAVLAERVAGDGPRPLLGDDPLGVLRAQERDRGDVGRRLASVVVDTDRRSPSDVAAVVCDAWRDHVGRSAPERIVVDREVPPTD